MRRQVTLQTGNLAEKIAFSNSCFGSDLVIRDQVGQQTALSLKGVQRTRDSLKRLMARLKLKIILKSGNYLLEGSEKIRL
jgi:hypothetical protein